ncbi:hypothetical protein SPHINGO8AM_100039 [Sphingomonas sp. 8AM]|nr:hypothetical protein SPHINGO8AM_100039 [Sphingomonas sp. 8AM]
MSRVVNHPAGTVAAGTFHPPSVTRGVAATATG